jgi:hypothetical protein
VSYRPFKDFRQQFLNFHTLDAVIARLAKKAWTGKGDSLRDHKAMQAARGQFAASRTDFVWYDPPA